MISWYLFIPWIPLVNLTLAYVRLKLEWSCRLQRDSQFMTILATVSSFRLDLYVYKVVTCLA